MPRPTRRAAALAPALALLAASASGQDLNRPPTTMYDPRMSQVRRASVWWDNHRGPTRRVIDQVALVPDVPTFLRAIAAWDDSEWFPILIDDAELAPKFLRAFRPARIVRYPGRAEPIPADKLWGAATAAAGKGWVREPQPAKPDVAATGRTEAVEEVPKPPPETVGEAVPDGLGLTPPGVVLTNPESPSLAGAVALAAGRFQPLMRWETKSRRGAAITEEEAWSLAREVEDSVGRLIPRYAAIGDGCDFLTLAAEYPDRYAVMASDLRKGLSTFDDLVGRDRQTLRRWAFCGRLAGSPSGSVYRAMCALFLQPASALLFDTYDEGDKEFAPYAMRGAVNKFPSEVSVTVLNGPKADLAGWHRALDPINRFGLVYVNSKGGPSSFAVSSGDAVTSDIPPTVPSVVLMNHSFSAADPGNARTLAGAWLSGGAYLFFGSMHEPYIQSFRTPTLVMSLLAEGVPIGAAVRMGRDEIPLFGSPWRLHLIGDPLFRLDPRAAMAPRWPPTRATSGWPSYAPEPRPAGPAATDPALLAWAVKATLLDAARGDASAPLPPDLEAALTTIRREDLPPPMRVVLDGLLIDALPRVEARTDAVAEALARVPKAERSPAVDRALSGWRGWVIATAIEGGDFPRAAGAWDGVMHRDSAEEFKTVLTHRVGKLAERTGSLSPWQIRLKAALRGREQDPGAKYLREELSRVEKLREKTTDAGHAPINGNSSRR